MLLLREASPPRRPLQTPWICTSAGVRVRVRFRVWVWVWVIGLELCVLIISAFPAQPIAHVARCKGVEA